MIHLASPRESAGHATYEFTEYLVDVLGVTDLGARWDGPLTYHPTCHLHRGLGVDRQPRELLAKIKDAEIRELPKPRIAVASAESFPLNIQNFHLKC